MNSPIVTDIRFGLQVISRFNSDKARLELRFVYTDKTHRLIKSAIKESLKLDHLGVNGIIRETYIPVSLPFKAFNEYLEVFSMAVISSLNFLIGVAKLHAIKEQYDENKETLENAIKALSNDDLIKLVDKINKIHESWTGILENVAKDNEELEDLEINLDDGDALGILTMTIKSQMGQKHN